MQEVSRQAKGSSTRQRTTRVVVLHGSQQAATSLVDSLPAGAWGATRIDPQCGPVDIAVVHGSARDWRQAIAQLRRQSDRLRIVMIATSLPEVAQAVNDVKVDRVLCDEADVVRTVAELDRAPLSEAERLEKEVQARTAILQQIKSQWEQSFDAVQDPMAVLDRDYRLIRVNRAYARHMGHGILDVPGRICHQLRRRSRHAFPGENDAPCASCPVATSQQQGVAAKTTLTDPQGFRWVVSAYPVDIPDLPSSLVVHYRDVTQEVERLAKMAQSDKMSTVGKLAGAVAHELNSPMTSIMVFSEVLARKTEDRPELHDHAMEINESAQRCRRLIQGLLRFARRPRRREPDSVALPELLNEVLPLVQHRIAIAHISLALDIADDLKPILGHVADVEHLVVDILSNAIEACAPKDTIHISAVNIEQAGEVELQVRDTGRGMSDEVRERAFDPFFTTKPSGQAAGLGLTTCEAMVGEMGGSIGLSSVEGEGTRAWVRLPMMPAST